MLGAPWNVDVELTRGCNRRCWFCGIHEAGIGRGDYCFMDVPMAREVAVQLSLLSPTMRVEFAGHGEPLLNPKRFEVFSAFRNAMPKAQLQVTTNGAYLRNNMRPGLEELFDSGIDIVVLDTYCPGRERLREQALAVGGDIKVMDYYTECLPQKLSPWANHRRSVRRLVVLMDDIGERDGESASRKLDNRGGNAGKRPESPLLKTCTMPFRTLVVAYSGEVLLCCMDWKHECVVGNSDNLVGAWYGPKLEAARKVLYGRERTFAPCCYCNRGAGPRAGLLPRYPKPTQDDKELLR